MKKSLISLLLLFSGALGAQALADQRYVTDQLVITLRAEAGEGARTLGSLRTGTPLVVLEEVGSFLRVRTDDGVEGYVLKQYVAAETPKPIIIARLEKENAKLTKELQGLQSAKAELDARVEGIGREQTAGANALTVLQQELAGLQQAYGELQEKSADVLQLDADRARLQQQNVELVAEVEVLRQENETLLFRAAFKWFFAGGGVLLVGWLLGRKSRQKRRGYSF